MKQNQYSMSGNFAELDQSSEKKNIQRIRKMLSAGKIH